MTRHAITAGALTASTGTDRITPIPQIRLSVIPDLADATGLAAMQLGHVSQQAGGQVQGDPFAYTSRQAQTTALTTGEPDAACISLVTAVAAWQVTHGKIIAVATNGPSGETERAAR